MSTETEIDWAYIHDRIATEQPGSLPLAVHRAAQDADPELRRLQRERDEVTFHPSASRRTDGGAVHLIMERYDARFREFVSEHATAALGPHQSD